MRTLTENICYSQHSHIPYYFITYNNITTLSTHKEQFCYRWICSSGPYTSPIFWL